MIRRWWRWRVELSRLRHAEAQAWRARVLAHRLYTQAAQDHGFPGALPEMDAARLASEIYQEQRQALQDHQELRP